MIFAMNDKSFSYHLYIFDILRNYGYKKKESAVFCKTFFRKLQDVFPKVARRFSKSCNSIFLKVANSIFPMLIVTSFPPSAFKIDPTLASDSAVVSSYQLPPCSAGAAPGWLLITASCTNPWEADVLRI